MRNRPGATWWDIATELDLAICDGGPAGCRKKWSKWTHHKGKIDSIGVIHWDGWNTLAYTNALHRILVWAAFGKNRSFRLEPEYLGLYHANQWAYWTGVNTFHIRIPWEDTVSDRKKAIRLAKKAGVYLKRDHISAWTWAHWKPVRAKLR